MESAKNKGPTFGKKRVARMERTPGPGTYEAIDSKKTRPMSGVSGCFSKTQRVELWKEETGKATLGPSYNTVTSDFDQGRKKGATFGAKRKE